MTATVPGIRRLQDAADVTGALAAGVGFVWNGAAFALTDLAAATQAVSRAPASNAANTIQAAAQNVIGLTLRKPVGGTVDLFQIQTADGLASPIRMFSDFSILMSVDKVQQPGHAVEIYSKWGSLALQQTFDHGAEVSDVLDVLMQSTGDGCWILMKGGIPTTGGIETAGGISAFNSGIPLNIDATATLLDGQVQNTKRLQCCTLMQNYGVGAGESLRMKHTSGSAAINLINQTPNQGGLPTAPQNGPGLVVLDYGTNNAISVAKNIVTGGFQSTAACISLADQSTGAQLTTFSIGTNNELIFTARTNTASRGARVTVRLQDPHLASQAAEVVTVTGEAIVVMLRTDANEFIVSTGATVKAAIEADPKANALISVAHAWDGTLTTVQGGNRDLSFTAKSGVQIPRVTVAYYSQNQVPMLNQLLRVDVLGQAAVVITLATDGAGAITTTANQILAAVQAHAGASAIVNVALAPGSNGTGVVLPLRGTLIPQSDGSGVVSPQSAFPLAITRAVRIVDPPSNQTGSWNSDGQIVAGFMPAFSQTALVKMFIANSNVGVQRNLALVNRGASSVTTVVGDRDLAYNALQGVPGLSVTIRYRDPAAANQALSVAVTGTAIVVNLATDGAGKITSTAAQVMAAVNADSAAKLLVVVTHPPLFPIFPPVYGAGAGVVTAMAQTPLIGQGLATLTTALGDCELTFVAKQSPGWPVSIAYVNPGPSNATTTAATVGFAITVTLKTDGSGNVLSTGANVKDAIEADSASNALVAIKYAPLTGTGAGVVAAMAALKLLPSNAASQNGDGVQIEMSDGAIQYGLIKTTFTNIATGVLTSSMSFQIQGGSGILSEKLKIDETGVTAALSSAIIQQSGFTSPLTAAQVQLQSLRSEAGISRAFGLINRNGAAGDGTQIEFNDASSQFALLQVVHDVVTPNGSRAASFRFIVRAANVMTERLRLDGTGIGFNAATPIAKPAVTGSRGSNAALASLLTALASYGLITDSSS